EQNKGYWLKTTADIEFAFEEPVSLSRSVSLSKSPYPYNQSTKQAFYFFESIENIQPGDWLIAYNGDKVMLAFVQLFDALKTPEPMTI
ncbi:MAG: hypothetical protein CMF60_07835, partial [Magnetococcales bacterium]|nr:hypothetical protein [Magnetococcales bacterium]